MSGHKDKVLEDKYAKKAVSFGKEEPETTFSSDLKSKQTLENLRSTIEKQRAIEEANKPKSLLRRKMDRIFGGVSDVGDKFLTGFKMGFIVGGIFGGLMGLYYATIYRTIMYVPMAALGSGGSFGFFMGIGMVMRTEMEGKDDCK